MNVLPDGSVLGQTFSGEKYNGKYPIPKEGQTYARYHEVVDNAVSNGFHKGDLSWSDYQAYCMGSGNYDGFDSDTIIS